MDARQRKLIVGYDDGFITVNNLMNGAFMKQLDPHKSQITALYYCNSDSALVSCSLDGSVHVCNESDPDGFYQPVVGQPRCVVYRAISVSSSKSTHAPPVSVDVSDMRSMDLGKRVEDEGQQENPKTGTAFGLVSRGVSTFTKDNKSLKKMLDRNSHTVSPMSKKPNKLLPVPSEFLFVTCSPRTKMMISILRNGPHQFLHVWNFQMAQLIGACVLPAAALPLDSLQSPSEISCAAFVDAETSMPAVIAFTSAGDGFLWEVAEMQAASPTCVLQLVPDMLTSGLNDKGVGKDTVALQTQSAAPDREAINVSAGKEDGTFMTENDRCTSTFAVSNIAKIEDAHDKNKRCERTAFFQLPEEPDFAILYSVDSRRLELLKQLSEAYEPSQGNGGGGKHGAKSAVCVVPISDGGREGGLGDARKTSLHYAVFAGDYKGVVTVWVVSQELLRHLGLDSQRNGGGGSSKRGVRFARVNVKWQDIMLSNHEARTAERATRAPLRIHPVSCWQAHADMITDISHISPITAGGGGGGGMLFRDDDAHESPRSFGDDDDDHPVQATTSPVLMTASNDGLAKMWCMQTGKFLGVLDIHPSHNKSCSEASLDSSKLQHTPSQSSPLSSESSWMFPVDTERRLRSQRKEAAEVLKRVAMDDNEGDSAVRKKEAVILQPPPHHKKKHPPHEEVVTLGSIGNRYRSIGGRLLCCYGAYSLYDIHVSALCSIVSPPSLHLLRRYIISSPFLLLRRSLSLPLSLPPSLSSE
jgi:hypothetical protein